MKKVFYILVALAAVIQSCKKDKKDASLALLSTTAITGITATTAQSGGTITDDGGSAITKRGICWATHASPTVGDSITTDGTGVGSFIHALSGLSANTVHYVRAYAINATGTAYGSEVSFTTNKGLPSVITTAITDIVPLSAKGGGNVINDGGSSVGERGVVFSNTTNPTIANNKIVATAAGTGVFTATVGPIAASTKYYVRAFATNNYGTAYGEEVSFTANSTETVTDIDGNIYGTVKIGTQTWMTSNLKVTKYRNGNPITNGLTGFDWTINPTGAFTFPNGDLNNKAIYGLLYNVFAVNDSRLLAPVGWHIASSEEWSVLEEAMGMPHDIAVSNGFYRGSIADKLQVGGSSGLNLQLSGNYFISGGEFSFFGKWGQFYTSTVFGTGTGSGADIVGNSFNQYRLFYGPSTDPNYLKITNNAAGEAYSVRCIKD